MDAEYHRQLFDRFGEDDHPPLAVRRRADRCFFCVEEVTPEGYVVAGHLFRADEVAEVRETPEGEEFPACDR